ncbi:hypothetical protein NDU88_005537 [Pleurodeles waltl]|uniref:Uncharacterized protein n=1 Tax=Pleurodeles waltl TaxID=8319 RepID=A0AAV7SM24_PLEWA|nr:hypothetical protein NDU88_005537 [Pleurodeles waltl]
MRRAGQADKRRVSPCVSDLRGGLPGGGEEGPPEWRSCGTQATAAVTGDAGVDAASGPPRSRRLRCGAVRARKHAARGGARTGPLPPRLPGCWGAALPPRAEKGGDPEGNEPPRFWGLKTTATEQQCIGKEALSHED